MLTYVLNKKNELLFNELKAYISIFAVMVKYLQHYINGYEMLRLINEAIINERKVNEWFKYKKSQLIGIILSKIRFFTKFEYYMVGNIVRCDEKISTFTVLYTLKRNSEEAFKRIVNLELIDIVYNNMLTSDEYYDSISELYLQISFLKAEMDPEGSYLLILKSFNNTLFRAGFRKDDLVSYKLLDLLEGVTLSHWYSFSEMELFIDKTYKMLNILNEATDGNGRKEAFNNLIVGYYPSLKEQYNITEDYNSLSNSYMYKKRCIDENLITLDNLYELYCGESKAYKDINYGMLDTWITLVNKGIEVTGGIDLVLKFLYKIKYPNSYIATNGENCYLAVAAILNNANFKEKIMEYICRKGGREGLISIIKSYIELNDSINGKPMFEMFFKLCELLIYY